MEGYQDWHAVNKRPLRSVVAGMVGSIAPVIFNADIAVSTITLEMESSATADTVQREADVTALAHFHYLLRQKARK